MDKTKLDQLSAQLKGELHYDRMMKSIYATDASVYKEMPLAVCYPKNKGDIKNLIAFARRNGTSLIPRAAGTSLAGQCVGNGIVVDVSKHFDRILEVNVEERWVCIEPGVVRDELNRQLKQHGLFFSPNTSTANRAMIGGMVGNNSCGSYSIVYGTTRDHVLELDTVLSDGSEACFNLLDNGTLTSKREQDDLEGRIYKGIHESLDSPDIRSEIVKEFPKRSIHRRNTGYAVDALIKMHPYQADGPDFNLCHLLAGSEGTLAFTTGIKIHLDPLPPKEQVLVCPHFETIEACLKAVLVAMRHQPRACEMMDKIVMDCTRGHREYENYRFFIHGDPSSLLIIEFAADQLEEAERMSQALIEDLKAEGLGYHFPTC